MNLHVPTIPVRLVRAGQLILIWAVITTGAVIHDGIKFELVMHSVVIAPFVWTELAYHTSWLILFPAIYWLAIRFPLETGKRAKHIAILAVLGVVFVLAHQGLTAITEMVLAHRGLVPPVRPLPHIHVLQLGIAPARYWLYLAMLAFCEAQLYYRAMQERTARAARLSEQLTATRLSALQAQLQPHFLFNALNSASMLTQIDPPAAQQLLVRLGDLLRRTLRVGDQLQVPLAEELDFLDRYIGIERARFGERLQVSYDVEDAALTDLVPSLILQPVIENAVRHGLAGRSDAGHIVVRAWREGAELLLEIADDGPGMPADVGVDHGAGVGLPNVRARLQTAFGDHHRFEFFRRQPSGLTVRLRIPRARIFAAAG